MGERFPRLLVATEFPPNASGGGPAVVRQMLKGWPAENLFWWSCFPERDQRFGQAVAAHRVASIPPKLYPLERWCRQKAWLMDHFWVPRAAFHFRRTLEEFKPDVVWVIPHFWSIPPLALTLPRARVRFHVSMHDYIDVKECIKRFGPALSGKMAAMADALYAGAATRDAISTPMIADLRARTGRDGAIARAGLEARDFENLAGSARNPAPGLGIAYAGTILVEEAFKQFVAALARIRNSLPAPPTLEFFGSHTYRSRAWFDSTWMREHGNLAEAPLSKALKECAWGFAPMSLTDEDPRYNRFSLPTKLISYLAAGLPVITLGHPESSIVKIAANYRIGLCVTATEPRVLEEELRQALSIPDAATKFAPEILRCARAEFDAARMRKTLHESLLVSSQ